MLSYISGDVTNPIGEGNKIIAHCVNDIGLFGSGVAFSILKKWPHVRNLYLDWHNDFIKKGNDRLDLGSVQFVLAEDGVVIANIVGQYGVGRSSKVPPVRYEALTSGFKKVYKVAKKQSASIHMPKIGSGLAGGNWDKIEKLIIKEFVDVDVFIYEL